MAVESRSGIVELSEELQQIFSRTNRLPEPEDYEQERVGRLWKNAGTTKHRKFLTAADLTSIVHCEIVQHLSLKDNAFRHNVKPSLVRSIVSDFKRDQGYIDRQFKLEQDRLHLVTTLKSMLVSERDHCGNLPSSRCLAEILKTRHGLNASSSHLCQLLREEIGLSYKAIRVLDIRTNTLRSLRLRQLYAVSMLEVLSHGYRIINID